MEANHWKRLWIPAVLALAAYLVLLELGAPERVTSVLLGGVPAALGLALGRRTGGLMGLLAFVLDSAVDAGFRGLSLDSIHLFLLLAYMSIGLGSGWVGESLRLRERSLGLLYRASRELSRQPDEESVLRVLPQMVYELFATSPVGEAVGVLRPEAGATGGCTGPVRPFPVAWTRWPGGPARRGRSGCALPSRVTPSDRPWPFPYGWRGSARGCCACSRGALCRGSFSRCCGASASWPAR